MPPSHAQKNGFKGGIKEYHSKSKIFILIY
nr:MAG TPA: hypothetical protein [Caudoviricetes sp.]